MSTTRSENARPLESLGISADEERAYRALLSRRLASASDLSSALGVPARATQRLLDALAAKGLATHSPERPRRYMPVPPEVAGEAIVSQRQAELARPRPTIPELKNHASQVRDDAGRGEVVELATSRDAERRIFEHAQ